MKTLRLVLAIAVIAAFGRSATAALYTSMYSGGFANGGVVPDGNTTGWSDSRTLSGLPDSITDVNVSLTISGGYNGDLYVYLTHSSGFSVLLNRVGRDAGNSFGYGDSGLNVLFDDSSTKGDIHTYQMVPGYATLISTGGRFSPDGRNVDPLLVLATDSRTRMLNQFNGLDPNGTWTLFVADLSSGDQATVTSWGLSITAIPEPATCGAVSGAAAAAAAAMFCTRVRLKRV
jgi:subtilisin-like proprotein convertase family protein